MPTKKNEALKALEIALKLESDGYKFYINASNKTKNLLGKEMLKSIAEEEKNHIKRIETIYEGLKKSTEWPETLKAARGEKEFVKFKTIFNKVSADIKDSLEIDPGDIEAIKIAMEMEKKGYKFYQERSEKAENLFEKEFYQILLKEESNHYEVLENTYEYLSNPGDWFSKKERPIYEG